MSIARRTLSKDSADSPRGLLQTRLRSGPRASARTSACAAVALALTLSAALGACDLTVTATASIGRACSSPDDCPSGQVCLPPLATGLPLSSTCQATCADNRECPRGLYCLPFAASSQRGCVLPVVDAASGIDAVGSSADATFEASDGVGDTDAGAMEASDAAVPPAIGSLDADASGEGGDATEESDGGPGDAAQFEAMLEASDGHTASDAPELDGTPDVDGAPEGGDAAGGSAFSCDGGGGPARGLVLFGGSFGNTQLGDTWIFDGMSWSNVGPLDAGEVDASGAEPPARSQAAMATACGYAVLTGGVGSDGNAIGDAWLWNGSSWRSAPTAPPMRYDGVAATFASTLYVFGGLDLNGAVQPPNTLLAWKGGTWSAPPASPSEPPPRQCPALATAPAGLLLLGGMDPNGKILGDSWLFTGTTWTLLRNDDGGAAPSPDGGASGPSSRAAAGATSWGQSVLVFGGQDSMGNALGDTWIWDGSNWSQPPTQDDAPPARMNAMMATLNGEVVLFGGLDANFRELADTWIWNGSWKLGPSSGPSRRTSGVMSSY